MTPKDSKRKYECISYILTGICLLISSRSMIQAQENEIIPLIGYAAAILGATSLSVGAFFAHKLHRNKTTQQHS